MAVKFTSADFSRADEFRFYPEDIKVHPELNGRYDKPDIESLIADILRNGQLTPILIRQDGGDAVLCAGFSRWRAVAEINKRKLSPVKLQLRCTYTRCNEQEAFLSNISENRFRNSTTMLDDAHNIKRLLNVYSLTEEQIIPIYFPTVESGNDDEKIVQWKEAKKWLKKRVTLISLSPEGEKAVRDGKLKETAAVAIAKLSQEQQRVVLKGEKVSPKKKVSTKPNWTQVRESIRAVINEGKFPGITGKMKEASDDMVEWLTRLIGDSPEL